MLAGPFLTVQPTMWLLPIVKAFAIVVVGGLGSIPGSILAALMLGYAETIVGYTDLDLLDRDRLGARDAADAGVPAGGHLRPARGVLRRRMFSKRIDLAGAAGFVAFMAVLPLVFGGNYLIGVLTVSVIYGIWAVSWDFMSGLTGRENFGHSLFIGVGAYTAGFLNTTLRLQRLVEPAGGDGHGRGRSRCSIGLPTLRLKGPYFALAMLSGAVIMQRLMLIFWEHTGGEEGINGIDAADPLAARLLLLRARRAGRGRRRCCWRWRARTGA